MKTIKTLIQDIKNLITKREQHNFNEDNLNKCTSKIAEHIKEEFLEHTHRSHLRMSNLGTKCTRKLWYSINEPEQAEPLDASARFKFLFGDIIEEVLLFLAKEAGHKVEGEQDEVSINGVKGHRDAVIDGILIDVKSASTYGYKKFEGHLEESNDSFGYLDQINAYLESSKDDSLIKNKNLCAFLVQDKTLGHITLDVHAKNNTDYSAKVEYLKQVLETNNPPEREYEDTEHGKKGNRKLCMECSYCPFKHHCWPNLRTFIYSNKPEYLTQVTDTPRVTEV